MLLGGTISECVCDLSAMHIDCRLCRKLMLENLPIANQAPNTQEARVDVAALTKVVRETLAR